MNLTDIQDRLERGERYVQSFRLIYGLNRLKGHGYVSSFVKACMTRLGYKAYYEPRYWQRFI